MRLSLQSPFRSKYFYSGEYFLKVASRAIKQADIWFSISEDDVRVIKQMATSTFKFQGMG